MTTKNNRIVFFDYLRVFSALAVVVIHITQIPFSEFDYGSINWHISNVYGALTRVAVPIFIMISGSLFLRKNVTVKEIYKKYILKILVIYLVWNVVYCLINGLLKGRRFASIVKRMVHGYDTLWFLLMIIGLYMIVPILQRIIMSKQLTKYFLILSFLFAYLFPQLLGELKILFGDNVQYIQHAYNHLNLYLPLGYTGYFILGYYITNAEIKKELRIIVYCLGAMGGIFTIFLTIWHSSLSGSNDMLSYGYNTLNVLLESVAVFVWAKYSCNKVSSHISIVAKSSLGIYLVHPALLEIMNKYGIVKSICACYPIVSIPLLSICIFAFSFLLTIIIKRIPFIGKTIV